jgi:hypothetical protein
MGASRRVASVAASIGVSVVGLSACDVSMIDAPPMVPSASPVLPAHSSSLPDSAYPLRSSRGCVWGSQRDDVPSADMASLSAHVGTTVRTCATLVMDLPVPSIRLGETSYRASRVNVPYPRRCFNEYQVSALVRVYPWRRGEIGATVLGARDPRPGECPPRSLDGTPDAEHP